jgi:hypothetical protein
MASRSAPQAVREDGKRRWFVFTIDAPTGHLPGRKVLWDATAEDAWARAEALGYYVARVEPAPGP